MSPPNVDPALMAEIDSEITYARSAGRPERLDVPAGTGVVVRFLPVKMGHSKVWFGRVGAHWYNKKHVNCPRITGKSFGGDPDADCPVCALAEEMASSGDSASQEEAKKFSSWPRYVTYVFCRETIDKDGDIVATKPKNLFLPRLFPVTSQAFLEITKLTKRAMQINPNGIVDPEAGYWIEMQKDKMNRWSIKFVDKEGPLPLRDDLQGQDLIDWTDQLCAKIKVDDYAPSSYADLSAFAKTIGRQLRDVPQDDPEAGYEPPPPAKHAAPPTRAAVRPAPVSRAAAPASTIEAELDAVPGHEDDGPPPAVHAPASAPRPRLAAPAPAAAAPVAVRPTVARPAAPIARPAAPVAAVRATPPPPPARRAVAPPPEAPEAGEEEDLPPETRDAAPVSEDTGVDPQESGDAEELPEVAPTPPQRGLSTALRRTLARAG